MTNLNKRKRRYESTWLNWKKIEAIKRLTSKRRFNGNVNKDNFNKKEITSKDLVLLPFAHFIFQVLQLQPTKLEQDTAGQSS